VILAGSSSVLGLTRRPGTRRPRSARSRRTPSGAVSTPPRPPSQLFSYGRGGRWRWPGLSLGCFGVRTTRALLVDAITCTSNGRPSGAGHPKDGHHGAVSLPSGTIGRAIVVMVGFAVIGFGVAVAWRGGGSGSVTPLVVVGVVLVAIGLLGHRADEVSGSWGNKAFRYKAAETSRKLDELADDAETPEPVKKQLRELSLSREVAEPEPTGPIREGARPRATPYVATHVPDDAGATVLLRLTGPGEGVFTRIQNALCVVTGPLRGYEYAESAHGISRRGHPGSRGQHPMAR
jgi:hypothetical protein